MRHANPCRLALAASILAYGSSAAAQEPKEAVNNGTDPTQLTTIAVVAYEYNSLFPDIDRHAPRVDLILPFGQKKDYSVRLRVPVVSNDVAGDTGFGLGDVSLMLTHVFGLTTTHGFVVQGELIGDTAGRAELGTGRNVFKGTLIYARFLPKGIFAPAAVHSFDLGGDDGRPKVSVTTFDFYYVPKFTDPRVFMTIDPALTFDWENERRYPSLAVTAGRVLGSAFGGTSQLYLKPTVLFGGERPGDWSIEVGFKVLGF